MKEASDALCAVYDELARQRGVAYALLLSAIRRLFEASALTLEDQAQIETALTVALGELSDVPIEVVELDLEKVLKTP